MMVFRILLAGFCALILACPFALHAQEVSKDIFNLPAGHIIFNVSMAESAAIEQDTLIVSLFIEVQNQDAGVVQNEINTVMKKAIDAAKAVEDVKITTQLYELNKHDSRPAPNPFIENPEPLQQDTRNAVNEAWHGRQGIILESKKLNALIKLTGELQEMGLTISGSEYVLSPEKAENVQDTLVESALIKIRAKAERAAKMLGKKEAEIVELNVVDEGYYPTSASYQPSDSEMHPPAEKAGETDVKIGVIARALLKP